MAGTPAVAVGPTVTITRVNSAGDARILVHMSDTGWSLAALSAGPQPGDRFSGSQAPGHLEDP